jgi:O-antigen/teichoic acid export membrane protein
MPEAPSSKRRITTDAVITQSGRALQVSFGIATFVVLARVLGLREFGVFSTIVAAQSACFAISDLGLGQLAVRAVAQRDLNQTGMIRAAIPWIYGSSSIVLLVSSFISIALVGQAGTRVAASVLIGLSYIHAPARIGVERGFWLGALQFWRATMIDVLAAGLRAAGAVAVWVAGGRSLLAFAVGFGISGALTVAMVRWWLTYPAPQTDRAARGRSVILLREAAPFALTSLSWNGFTELPKMLLAPSAGPAAVGLYAAGARILTTALVPLQSLLLVITPRLFAFAGRDRSAPEPEGHPLLNAIAIATLAGGALAILVIGLAPVLPLMLGEEYRRAVPILQILAVSLPFLALAFVTGDWLSGVGKQHLRFLLTLTTAVLAVPVSLLAAHARGASGAAIGYSALTAFLACITTIASWRYYRS